MNSMIGFGFSSARFILESFWSDEIKEFLSPVDLTANSSASYSNFLETEFVIGIKIREKILIIKNSRGKADNW